MSLHDRNYARGSRSGWSGGGNGGGDFLRQVAAFFNWSFPIGRYFGIRVRVHILFLLLIATEIWPKASLTNLGISAGEQMLSALRWMALLFGSVLLHEFGHCFGCRSVGGRADDILMWPLGGLAFCDPPKRPWPEFVTVVCGPLVNVALAGLSLVTLLIISDRNLLPVSLNPFDPWSAAYWSAGNSVFVRLLADLFVVNYALLLFNVLMPFLPFDGGRLWQIALWKWVGYARSMHIATTLGMVGAVAIAVFGLLQGQTLLAIMGVFGFFTCMQQRQQLRFMASAEPDIDPRFAAAYEKQSGERGSWFDAGGGTAAEADAPAKAGAVSRWREAREQKRIAAATNAREQDEAEMNRILDKVHASGLQSLTARERETLQRATDRQRGG